MSEPDYIRKLIKWAGRDEWRDMFDEVFDMHVAAVLEDFGLEFDQLDDVIGENRSDILWTWAFEDFATQPRDADGLTVVDDYLKRRGWKDGATSRRYLEALRDSAPGLYAIGEIVPSVSLVLHDRVGDAPPVTVAMRSQVGGLRGGDVIAARIIEVSGRTMLSDSVLVFHPQAGEDLAAEIGLELARLKDDLEALAETKGLPRPGDEEIALAVQMYLLQSAPLYSDAWLAFILAAATGRERPEPTNSDGDAIEFQTLRFAFRPGAGPDTVRDRLDGVPGLQALGPTLWTWVDRNRAPDPDEAQMSRPPGPGMPGAPALNVRGTLELADDALLVEVDSPERAEAIKALLAAAAPGLLAPPTSVVHAAGEGLDADT